MSYNGILSSLTRKWIIMIKLRQSQDSSTFIMSMSIPGKMVFILSHPPIYLQNIFTQWYPYPILMCISCSWDPLHKWFIVRRAGLLWSQQDFEWRWSVPLFKCLTVLEFSFILFDLCLLITFFNFIMNYVPIVAFWIFTYLKIWILWIMFCFIWSYWIIYFLACLEVSWRVVS